MLPGCSVASESNRCEFKTTHSGRSFTIATFSFLICEMETILAFWFCLSVLDWVSLCSPTDVNLKILLDSTPFKIVVFVHGIKCPAVAVYSSNPVFIQALFVARRRQQFTRRA
jgi:hypothetical protein